MKKPFGRLLENHLGCDSVQKTSLHAGSVVLNRNCSHVKLVWSLIPGHRRVARQLLFTNTVFLFFKHFLGWIFFLSWMCASVSGKAFEYHKARIPRFLYSDTLRLATLVSFFLLVCFAFQLGWVTYANRAGWGVTGRISALTKMLPVSYFHGVLWPVSYSVQLKLISCPSSF